MGNPSLSSKPFTFLSLFPATVYHLSRQPTNCPLPLGFTNKTLITSLRTNCRTNGEDADTASAEGSSWVSSPSASPYQILGVDPATCSPPQLKAAFRARVKKFHPDVCKDITYADAIIQRVIQAYEILSTRHADATEGACLDPFEMPECEAYDLFVNEVFCVGKGCPYSCVQRAPYVFSFTSENGTARAISLAHRDDYQVQLAVGQCPRKCIHYVTPSQRAVLEDILNSVLDNPFDEGEAAFLESLISKAAFANKRYQEKPKRQPKVSTEYVDWS